MGFLSKISQNIVPFLESKLGVWHDIIAYIVGAIAIMFLVLSFQMKNRKRILLVHALASITWICYYLLNGDLTSGLIAFTSVVRNGFFLLKERYAWAKSIVWLFVFIAINLTFGIISFSTYKDIFPILGGIGSTTAFFMTKEKDIRIFSFIAYVFWMCNSISKGYLMSFISDFLTLSSVIIALIRYRKKVKTK
ncbi:MAG: YgjV family protein [Clostridia bacterium]|nr:YgjV family protein [Clostridia bacterium]